MKYSGNPMNRVLLVTEKCLPEVNHRDGGYQLVQKLIKTLGNRLDIMQFTVNNYSGHTACKFQFRYEVESDSRFQRRILNGKFVAKKVKEVEHDYDIILFVHISLQFNFMPHGETKVICFPMFTGNAYRISGEKVPDRYIFSEGEAFTVSDVIISPSYVEKRQLVHYYGIPHSKIKVIPRSVQLDDLSTDGNRPYSDTIKLCALGSIKPQKNTVELIRFFQLVTNVFSNAELTVIGPIQNQEYYELILEEVARLGLVDSVKFSGFVAHDQLNGHLNDKQIHICFSRCETFGRSVFETMAFGIPNLCLSTDIAAEDFIPEYMGIRYISSPVDGIQAIEELLSQPPSKSDVQAIRQLFGSVMLDNLLESAIVGGESLVVSDYDGTLFHKDDSRRTQKSVSAFMTYPVRVICSSRSIPDLLNACHQLSIESNYLIGWGGAVIANGNGDTIWTNGFSDTEIKALKDEDETVRPLLYNGFVVQYSSNVPPTKTLKAQFSVQEFKSTFFYNPKYSTKLLAIIKLLEVTSWKGQVDAFGDGQYDLEYLKYFDGTLISLCSGNDYCLKSARIMKSYG
jgi:glycosyltransferase involved in cell wall biosynthesis/hydroxymethylpyrimidine pyrophosphatase-like HAD family hydrolase